MLEKAPYGVALVDSEGQYLFVNREFTHITGYSREDVPTGREWFAKAFPDERYRRFVAEKWSEDRHLKVADRTFAIVSKDGAIKEIEFRTVLLDDGRDVVTLLDITERKRAEEALQESERKYRTLFEGSRDAIYIASAHGQLVDANQAFLDLFGFTRAEMPQMNAKDVYLSTDDRRLLKQIIVDKGYARDFEMKLRKKDGTVMDCLLTVTTKREENGLISEYHGIVRDVTAFNKAQATIRYMAYHDPLTGLPNRSLFNDRLNMARARAERSGQKIAVMMLDLDKLKRINDTLGHETGDMLLRSVAQRLSGVLRKSDTIARMGGDEFLVIVPEVSSAEDAWVVTRKILDAFAEPFQIGNRELPTSTSIGFAMYPDDGLDGETLIRHADIAMYEAKIQGGSKCLRYNPKSEG
jgi:diguanylate cyclase (GGDEF)-like protein/PAS domain S-box-containing protein